MKNFIRGAGLLLLAMGSSAVMAVPITGNITFVGNSTVTGTIVSFTDFFNNPNSAMVGNADGDFAAEGIGTGNTAIFNTLDYSSPFSPVTPLWTIGGFTFDLLAVTATVAPPPGAALLLSGSGVLMNASGGYTNTLYRWEYSGTESSSRLVFSAASGPTSIPEPGSLALLGLGLVGFAVTGYKRRRTQA